MNCFRQNKFSPSCSPSTCLHMGPMFQTPLFLLREKLWAGSFLPMHQATFRQGEGLRLIDATIFPTTFIIVGFCAQLGSRSHLIVLWIFHRELAYVLLLNQYLHGCGRWGKGPRFPIPPSCWCSRKYYKLQIVYLWHRINPYILVSFFVTFIYPTLEI